MNIFKTPFKGQLVLIVALGLSFLACTPRNAGFLTVVNSDVVPLDFSVDSRPFSVLASNHITKEVAGGEHAIRLGTTETVKVTVLPKKTTVLDLTGLSCFAVADFAGRYKGGPVKIIETFRHQRVFAPASDITVILGSFLPKKAPAGAPVTRIQQIDCEDIDNLPEVEAMLLHAK